VSANSKPATPSDATAGAAASSTKLGVLLDSSVPGALIVEYEGSGPLAARSAVALDQPAIARAIATRQRALLLFENGDARLPIVVGLIQPEPAAALLQSLLAPALPPTAPAKPATEVRVDGKRVVLEGTEEVTLKCGDASITLRRDGKVILRGAYVETTAKGVNRIRGGSVKIN
jgi:hypothetical protein